MRIKPMGNHNLSHEDVGPASTFLLAVVTYVFGDKQAAARLSELAAAISPNQMAGLSENASYHELEPLLHLISLDCSTLGYTLNLPDDLKERWSQVHQRELARSVIIQYGATRVMAALADAQIRAVPLKGYYLASGFYERKSARPYRDLDLLVEENSLPTLDKMLLEAGLIPQPKRPSFVPAPAYTVYSLTLEDSEMAMEVDIHIGMHWPEEYYGRTDLHPEELWSEASPQNVEGQPSWALSPAHVVITTLLDVAVNHRYARLIKFRDLFEFLRKADIGWDEVERYSRHWEVCSFVGPGLHFMSDLSADFAVPPGVLDSVLPSYPLMKTFLRTLPLTSLPNHRSRSYSPANLLFFLLADTLSERARGLIRIPSHMLKGRQKV